MVVYTEKIKKTSRKKNARCGDDVTIFMLATMVLVFAQLHYKSLWYINITIAVNII